MAERSAVIKKLKIPLIQTDSASGGTKYETATFDLKMIKDYSGYTFSEIMELGIFGYNLLLRDAIISALSKTDEGTEMLNRAWILEQTAPEIKNINSNAVVIYGE